MNPYRQYVQGVARLNREAQGFPLGGFPACPRPTPPPGAPRALIFSPHPDDECIIGGLALRLLRESGWHVLNVAVTQGSNKARQQPRLIELKAACDFLGFGLVQAAEHGLEDVKIGTRQANPAAWGAMVNRIASILREHQPHLIFFPHDRDWNSTHIGTHWLLVDALANLGQSFRCWCVETEFWGQMDTPNLAVESPEADVADLVGATSFHVGEVQRNPYHLLLPPWMQDNVRRGGELVGGQGKAAPQFTFATLYRLRLWSNGTLRATYAGGQMLPANVNPAAFLEALPCT